MSRPAALVLTGDLGMGHHVVSQIVAGGLEELGWTTSVLDCMSLLGPVASKVGDRVFHWLTAVPSLYDGTYFAHLRTGSRLACSMDRAATSRLVPALTARLAVDPAQVVVSTFATGASAIAKLVSDRTRVGSPATVALCTDVSPHRLWVRDGLDLFVVTSPAAAAAVRRYAPRIPVAVVPPPVRAEFYHPPSRAEAREELGIDAGVDCVLLMGGGWGLGPMAQTARTLADRGVAVLAVAGHNVRLTRALAEVAHRRPRVRAFGFSDRIPTLMAAADLILTTPGATTCSEARVVGRPLMLLDVMPGHGRDNVQHQLELGHADVCDPEADRLLDCVLDALERAAPGPPSPPEPDRFSDAFTDALAMVGIVPNQRRTSESRLIDPASALLPQEVH